MRWYEHALELAADSEHPTQQMAAVVVRGGNVISSAVNGRRHAEARALHPHRDFHGCVLFVGRVGNRMSRPCRDCMILIARAGISRVFYVGYDGLLRSVRPNALIIPAPPVHYPEWPAVVVST